jgi:PAS domain S-box-containing protein
VTACARNAAPTPAPEHSSVQDLLDFSPDVICTCDKEGRFVQVSAASRAVWGYEPRELKGRAYLDFVPEADRVRTLEAAAQVMNGQPSTCFPNYFRCKDGSLKRITWSAKWNAEQEVVYCIARDASGQEAAERRAAAFEERLYRAYKLAAIGWWELQVDTNQITTSDELYTIYGLTRANTPRFTHEQYLELVHPDDLAQVLHHIALVWDGHYHQYDHRLIKATGEEIHVMHYVQTERDHEGRVVKIHGTTKDITARKQPELALRASQQKLQDIIESLGDGFLALDRQWTVTYWNRNAERVTGRRRAEVVGKSFWELYPKAKALRFYTEFNRAVAENRPVYFEEYSPSHQAWMEVSAHPAQEGLSVYIKDITARKTADQERRLLNEKLQTAQESLQRVLESMTDGFFILDRQWTIRFATDKVAAMLGLHKESYLGKNLWESFPDATSSRFYSEYHRAFAQNTFVSFEEYLPSFDMWFEVNAYPAKDELSVYIKNISERRRQEQALQISNERFHFVSMATSDTIWDWNLLTGELYINQSFTRVFGYELDSAASPSQLWKDHLYPEDRDRILASQAAAIQNPTIALWEDSYRFVKKCGETAYVTDRAVIIRNEEGRAVRMVGAVQDITERRRQEKRLEFMAKATSEVIWEREIDGDEVEINGDKLKQLAGYDLGGNFMKRSFWLEKVHPDDLSRLQENRDYALQHDFDFYVQEYRLQKADGSWLYIKDRTHVIKNDAGKAVRLIGAMEDITIERLTEKAIVESEISYRQLFNNAPLPTMIYDAVTLQFRDVNSAAVQHYGYSKEELLARTMLDLRCKDEHPDLVGAVAGLNHYEKALLGVVTHLKKDGEKIKVEVSITKINYKGRPAILITVSDVTERQRLQSELTLGKINHQKDITKAIIETQEKERSEIGKELHDNVNQMLTTAKLYVENIGYYPEQSTQFATRSVGILQDSINEIRRLSRALVTPTIRDVGFKDTLSELVASYLELHLFEVHTSFDFDETSVPKGVKLTIYRILQEAFNNTVKYAGASMVQVSIRCSASTLKLVYTDDGVGFNPATVKGGIGLQNIQNRTDAYHGQVQVRSSAGAGCELKIIFPLAGPGGQPINTD